MFGRTQLTAEERIAKERRKAEERRQREANRAAWAEKERERIAAFPHFVVRETREVTVQAENMNDAIALASAAFKEGQDDDHTIKWHKPYGVDGDTVDAIRVVNIKAVESQFD